VLERLAAMGIPVCPVTSKTPAELDLVCRDLSFTGPAGFENGAGIRHPDGSVTLGRTAVPIGDLHHVLVALRARTRVRIRSFRDLTDLQLSSITGLSKDGVTAARRRVATMPLAVDPAYDETLREALPDRPPVRLVRGNRFLHLQGRHDKADVVPLLLEALGPAPGVVVACGDAPNDLGLLAAADIPVIVPSAKGPNGLLVARFPSALVAPLPHGWGWAATISSLLETLP
jgi:mannosyl-3-phosphoglycerate phosphatase